MENNRIGSAQPSGWTYTPYTQPATPSGAISSTASPSRSSVPGPLGSLPSRQTAVGHTSQRAVQTASPIFNNANVSPNAVSLLRQYATHGQNDERTLANGVYYAISNNALKLKGANSTNARYVYDDDKSPYAVQVDFGWEPGGRLDLQRADLWDKTKKSWTASIAVPISGPAQSQPIQGGSIQPAASIADAVNVDMSGDLRNPKTSADFYSFLLDLKNNDPRSYSKRFDTLSQSQVMFAHQNNHTIKRIFAYHEGKIVGMADYSDSPEYGRKVVANVNNVVLGRCQGVGVGKKLYMTRESLLKNEGFRYQMGGVYKDNTEQLARLNRNGWREISNPDPDDEMTYYWKALDSRYADVPPKEIN
jgi:hypothetical protein